MVTRAVHLEVAFSLSTDSFIMCLRRFIARRGKPTVIYSDNGTDLLEQTASYANVSMTVTKIRLEVC